eukprot:COSAG02_NODE_70210_length_197_cov_22.020408_1_plen_52_part_01
MTPIRLALKVKDYDRVLLLVNRGADVSLLGPAGLEAALAAAAEQGGHPKAAA